MSRERGSSGASGRVGKSLAVYVVAAALAWWAVPWLRETLLLPTLFVTLARWTLVAGAFVVAVLAWRYPRMGASGEAVPWERE